MEMIITSFIYLYKRFVSIIMKMINTLTKRLHHMHKIGVVGPKKSVERIMNYSKEMDTDLIFLPFTYNLIEETKSIVEKYDEKIDYWLFSGITPYKLALETTASRHKFNYIFRASSEIFEGVLHYALENKKIPKAVSIDLLNLKNFEEVDSNFFDHKHRYPSLEQYYFYYEPTSTIEEIYEFHHQLWENKKIDLVITTYPEVYEWLKERKIPTYWTGPSKQNTFYAIRIIQEKIKTRYYKDTQTTSVKLK